MGFITVVTSYLPFESLPDGRLITVFAGFTIITFFLSFMNWLTLLWLPALIRFWMGRW